jgi:DNA repair protein RadC
MNFIKISDMPSDERPREKLAKHGAEALSNSELLAILLRTGSRSKSAIDISRELLSKSEKGIAGLPDLSMEELCSIGGIGMSKATQVKAALELSKRISRAEFSGVIEVRGPGKVADLFIEEFKYLKIEKFAVVFLDTKNQIMSWEVISVGSLNASIVHPREVFNKAIKKSAASVILVHNHPSGKTNPSREDIDITNRLIEAGKIVGINVLDHIIVGHNCYYSFKEEHLI